MDLKIVTYVVVIVDGFISSVCFASTNRNLALSYAKDYAGDWENATESPDDNEKEIYFNQRHEGDMDQAVSVQVISLSALED